MNWKRIALVVVAVLLIVRFSPQIRAAVGGLPLVNKVIG